MPIILKINSYAPILKEFGHREEMETWDIVWTIVVLLILALILLLTNNLKIRIQQNRNLNQGLDQLEKISLEIGLNYLEEAIVKRMAKTAKLPNPALLLTSFVVFDRAIAIWMKNVRQMPWLEMEKQVEHLVLIRKKSGFRYLSSSHHPTTTRELAIGQKLYLLTLNQKCYELLSTTIIGLDDLAIRTSPFLDSRNHQIRFQNQNEIRLFFWTEQNIENQFKTQIIKKVDPPIPYLLLEHGEHLLSRQNDKSIFCDLNLEEIVKWLPFRHFRKTSNALKILDTNAAKIQPLKVRFVKLSSTGFTFETNERIEVGDFIQIKGRSPLSKILQGLAGKAIKINHPTVHLKFFELSSKDRDIILQYIVPKMVHLAKGKTK